MWYLILDKYIGVPSIGARGGPGPPQFFKNLQAGPLSFLKICRRAPQFKKKNYFHRTLMDKYYDLKLQIRVLY